MFIISRKMNMYKIEVERILPTLISTFLPCVCTDTHLFQTAQYTPSCKTGPRGWYQWEGGEYREGVKEGEYGGNIYLCIQMEK
jgi:hypothetical protein